MGRARGTARWRSPAALAVGAAALALFVVGGVWLPSLFAEGAAARHDRIAEERPPLPQRPYDVFRPNRLPTAPRAARPHPHPAPVPAAASAPASAAPAKSSSGSPIAPASAGTNGSFAPPPPGRRKAITPRTMARLEHLAASQSAVLLNGIALAPPSAPEAIKAAITGANAIVGRPYVWGGGHSSWYSRGYDCSGAVSYALGAGGLLRAPLNSGQLESWGAPGPGRWVTVYANAGHVYAVIAGLRWDTVGDARGTGPRWHAALPYPQGFVARHPPGY